MALPAAISCLLLSLLIAVTPLPASCEERALMEVEGSLIQCYDPAQALTNATEFRASLLPLLATLPSAAAPTGFASLGSTGRAFVRGLYFGEATVPSECLGCLSLAAKNLTSGCGATTRRAGIWTAGCFLAYGDTHASSPAEDAFRSLVILQGRGSDAAPHADAPPTYYSHYVHAWLLAYKAQPVVLSAVANISGPRMVATADTATAADISVRSTMHVLAQCARDRTKAECLSCLLHSSRLMDWDLNADRRDGGVAAAIVSFNCYIGLNVSTAVPQEIDAILRIVSGVLRKVIGVLRIVIVVLTVLLVLGNVLVVLATLCLILAIGKKKANEKKMNAHPAPAGEYSMV